MTVVPEPDDPVICKMLALGSSTQSMYDLCLTTQSSEFGRALIGLSRCVLGSMDAKAEIKWSI